MGASHRAEPTVHVLALLLSILPTSPAMVRLPMQTTPAAKLSTADLEHHELVRIRRDWGKETFHIALDGWTPRQDAGRIADVRLWWLKTHKRGERGPFSDKSRRHFEVSTHKRAADRWDVHMKSDGKTFVFRVEADGQGGMAAYATVVTRDGVVDRCRTSRGELRARTFLGVPTGIDRLSVTCTDAAGRVRRGHVRPG